MSWKAAWIIMICLFTIDHAWGQKTSFKLPPGVSSTDYEPGTVWVKVKEKYRDIFLNANSGRKSVSNVRALQIKQLLASGSRNKSAARLAPRKVNVDISRYFKLAFDKSYNLENYIDELNATGYFEIIEPVYLERSLFTPNDPAISSQYHLSLIKAAEAWDITRGSSAIVIGIIDSGGDLNHPDLQNNIYIDPADPTDGIDNDSDGYIDNNRGWDFSGSDAALIGTPGFAGDNNPSVFSGNRFGHGTMVAGCASATTNDGIGISAVGFNTKLLFTKHYADNQPDNSTFYSSNLYEGVLYAALHGARIINCSWGNPNPSGIAQDIINYVTLELGCLVVAAAGNSNSANPLYPAAYDNVLSVASSDENDVRSWFSNYGKSIDIIAPGSNIYTTNYDNGYRTDSGTSLSAPIVAGAAALVWAHNPQLTALQVAEQLRISADESIYLKNPSFLHKLGRGRLDIYKALTLKSPSIRASNQVLVNAKGEIPGPGDAVKVFYDFTNFLRTTSSGLTITITSSSPFLTITQNQFRPGVLATNRTINNSSRPFEFTFASNLPIDQPVEALLTYSDGAYQDTQMITFTVPSYIDVNENNITTTITSAGRIGYTNAQDQNNGSGFIYDDESLLFEMGLILGTSNSQVFDNLRSAPGLYNQDFTSASKIRKSTLGERSYSEVTGSFRNAQAAGTELLLVSFQSMVWKEEPYQNFIILEYKVKNTSANALPNFFMGIFADWDIESGGSSDRASWDSSVRLGYVFPSQATSLPRAGIQALNGNANYYAIDNDQTVPGNPLGIYDGFTDTEKFRSVSSGLSKTQAGGANGRDVSHVVSSGPYNIPAGAEVTIAFALHAAGSLQTLIESAKYADSLYNFTFKATKPTARNIEICEQSDALLQATGAAKFHWYGEPFGGAPIFSGPQFVIPNLQNDTTVFVSNADKTYESLRTAVTVTAQQNPTISSSGDLEFCEGREVLLTASQGNEYTWSTGLKTQSIEVSESGAYHVAVRRGQLECTSKPTVIVVHPAPSSSFEVSSEIVGAGYEATFSNEGTGAVSWYWDFGDGQTSTQQNPVHHYDTTGSYTISLTSTSAQACEATEVKSLGVITGSETPVGQVVKLYPNPVYHDYIVMSRTESNESAEIEIFNSQGSLMHQRMVHPEEHETLLDLSSLATGVYHVRLTIANETYISKISVVR